MTLGFRATDEDDDEPAPDVRDGVASEREPTHAEHVDLFVGLCERLRAMGAIEVRAERFRAVWPVQASQPAAPVIQRVKLGEDKPSRPLERFDGEQLSPEDRQRRQSYNEVRELIRGES